MSQSKTKLLKIAEKFEKDLKIDTDIVVEEHDVEPVSYMAFSNLETTIIDCEELFEILNDEDDLPQWCDELLAIAKNNVSKVLDYVRSQKTIQASHSANIIKNAAGKYDHIDFKPPQSVADAAARGLELRKKNKGKGGLSTQQAKKEGVGSGVARAVSLKNRKNLSPSTVRRMKAFFSRHEKNFKIDSGKSPSTDRGYISGLLWGGNAGKSWANKVCRQMEAADKKK